MQKVMQNNAAVFRTGHVLEEGVKLIDKCAKSLREDIKTSDRSLIWNSDLVERHVIAFKVKVILTSFLQLGIAKFDDTSCFNHAQC